MVMVMVWGVYGMGTHQSRAITSKHGLSTRRAAGRDRAVRRGVSTQVETAAVGVQGEKVDGRAGAGGHDAEGRGSGGIGGIALLGGGSGGQEGEKSRGESELHFDGIRKV